MTERQWLNAKNLAPMLRCLYEQFHLNRNKQGRRKLRLFACGLARCVWLLVPDGACRDTVAACEDFADGTIDAKQMARQWQEFKAEQHHFDFNPWVDCIMLRKVLRANHWGKNAYLLDQAANESRLVEADVLQDAGAEVQVRREMIDRLKGRQIDLLRHIFGNPFRPYAAPLFFPRSIVQLLDAFRNGEDCAFALHDALVEAGQLELAEHFQNEKEHLSPYHKGWSDGLPCPRGCWVVDLLQEKRLS